ncbi:hypothetical protein ABKV19_004107 [Rosa sericea]
MSSVLPSFASLLFWVCSTVSSERRAKGTEEQRGEKEKVDGELSGKTISPAVCCRRVPPCQAFLFLDCLYVFNTGKEEGEGSGSSFRF